MGDPTQQWQADLVDMSRLKKVNDGTTFILTVIDVFSKLAWCVPLKNKSAASLVAAFTQLLSNGAPNTLQTGKGTEVLKQPLQKLLKRARCASFCDAQRRNEGEHCREVQSDPKDTMARYFTKTHSVRYADVLQAFMRSYNDTYHHSIGMAPSEVTSTNQETLWQRLYGHESVGTPKFRVGDRVCISKAKRHFENGYMANWTEELFTIVDRHRSDPLVYRLVDSHGDKWDGTFYEPELQKVVVPKGKTYRVESVLRWRNKRREVLVKWSGTPHPSTVG